MDAQTLYELIPGAIRNAEILGLALLAFVVFGVAKIWLEEWWVKRRAERRKWGEDDR
jgi:hypothetical protein